MHLTKRIWLLVLFSLWSLACPVQAQSAGRLLLQAPDISKFPNVALTFEAYTSTGGALTDLTAADLQVTENDAPVSVDSLTRLQPGLHIILAFNAAQPMAAVGGAQTSRFDLVKNSLMDWIRSRPADAPDELSLVTNTGPQATRLSGPVLWANALQAYTPDLNKAQASLGSLITALDLAGDPTRRATSKRAILYVTGPLPDANLAALNNLADRAVQLGVRISTWLVLPAAGETRSGTALAELASKTGGEFFTFSGTERLPDPEVNFTSLRYLYRLSYTSAVRQSGTQRIQLSIRRGAARPEASTTISASFSAQAEQRYTLNLQAPNPFFLSPPTQVERTWTKPAAPAKPVLQPAEVSVQAIVEYPDGLRRPLRASRLYVDGKLAYEMTADPFNPLVWSLADVRSNGRHTLKVVVEDIFGLTQSSIEIPVDVKVEAAPALTFEGLVAELKPYQSYLLAGAGALLLLVIVLIFSRLRQARSAAAPAGLRPKKEQSGAKKDSQPVWSRLSGASIRPRPVVPMPAQPRPFTSPDANARLSRVAPGSAQMNGDFIALSQEVIRLGSDPRQADVVIDSEAVDGLHAQVRRLPDGRFSIRDQGSITGTWVNFIQSPDEGTIMEHGDLIQLGRETFRFELMDPPPPRQAQVTPYQEEA